VPTTLPCHCPLAGWVARQLGAVGWRPSTRRPSLSFSCGGAVCLTNLASPTGDGDQQPAAASDSLATARPLGAWGMAAWGSSPHPMHAWLSSFPKSDGSGGLAAGLRGSLNSEAKRMHGCRCCCCSASATSSGTACAPLQHEQMLGILNWKAVNWSGVRPSGRPGWNTDCVYVACWLRPFILLTHLES